MKTLYVVRHCKAEGQPVSAPLTPEGARQAETLAEMLVDKGVERIVSSPFLRARQTAAPLARRLGLEVEEDPRLGERVLAEGDLPDWREDLRRSFDDLDLRLPGGESSREAMARAAAAVEDALAGAEVTVMVTHGNLMALLLKRFDDRFGFAQWAGLTNPDLFRLTFGEAGVHLERLWQ